MSVGPGGDRVPCLHVCVQAELQSTKRQVAQNRATVEQLYEARDGAQNTMLDIKVELDQARAEMQVRCRGTQYIHCMHTTHAGLVTPRSWPSLSLTAVTRVKVSRHLLCALRRTCSTPQ